MKKTVRKCRNCNKEFRAVFDVWYCSANCEKASHNPVAKYNKNRAWVHKPKKGKGSYSRKRNKVVWNLEKEG